MSEHTPGPWKVGKHLGREGWSVHMDVGNRGIGMNIAAAIYGISMKNCLANAHLISAAPELLGALESLIENTEQPPDSSCSCHISPPCGDCVDYSSIREVIKDAKAAIAKARGEV